MKQKIDTIDELLSVILLHNYGDLPFNGRITAGQIKMLDWHISRGFELLYNNSVVSVIEEMKDDAIDQAMAEAMSRGLAADMSGCDWFSEAMRLGAEMIVHTRWVVGQRLSFMLADRINRQRGAA